MFLVQRVLIKDNFTISTATAYYMTDRKFYKSTCNEYPSRLRPNEDFYQHRLDLVSQ